jgi:hypothetical protein
LAVSPSFVAELWIGWELFEVSVITESTPQKGNVAAIVVMSAGKSAKTVETIFSALWGCQQDYSAGPKKAALPGR